ncbi:MAG TPA: hypothetical protein VK102_06560 [Sphingobacterium sp.]|nr:hypothetical protein [Sphingobacterium sp.]
MKVYSISYDLSTPGTDYDALYEAIKQYRWAHYLESTWWVATNDSANQIFNNIQPHIDDNDRILVIELKDNKAGWLPQEAWDWLNNNL